MKRRIVLKIHGEVQGVGLRFRVKKFSQESHINGWAKNENNGMVSIIAEGEENDLHQLLHFCYNKIPNAQVEYIDVVWERPEGLEGFEIK